MPDRFVFDTNAILSAVLVPKSKPRQAFDKANRAGILLVSDEVIEELNDVLRRAEFEKYVTETLRVEFLAALLRDAELVQITENVKACRDPRDDKFLSLAISGNANCIVSGDKDLLVLNPFRGIPILPPAQNEVYAVFCSSGDLLNWFEKKCLSTNVQEKQRFLRSVL